MKYTDILTKSSPAGIGGGNVASGFLDAYRSKRAPSKNELLQSYKNLAYSCVQINAKSVASVPLRAYFVTKKGQRSSRFWEHGPVSREKLAWIKSDPGLAGITADAVEIRELYDHPILKLLSQVNPFMNKFDLFEWTTASQEVDGNAYWFPARERDGSGKPTEIWPLEAHRVTPIPDRSGNRIISYYEYSSSLGRTHYETDEIIHFKYISLADPLIGGLSPLRAAFEQANVSDKLLAYEEAVLDNRARPDMLISPKDVIGKNEAARLERKFQQKFRGGGSGGIVVGESGLDYKALTFPPSDLAALEIRKVSKEELANAFDVPIALLRTEDVNRANAEAAEYGHAKRGVLPRCRRMQEKMNERLCPMFDERLFVAFDNPVPDDETAKREKRRVDIQTGVSTINEERIKDGKPPIAGGDEPLIPNYCAPLQVVIQQSKATLDSTIAATQATRETSKNNGDRENSN